MLGNTNDKLQQYIPIIILILQFFISGIFILSTPFTKPQSLEILAIWMFLSISVGTFIGGIMGDFLNRKLVFHMCSAILLVGSFIIQFDQFWGYLIASFAIGPLNNLTFVILMQIFPTKKDKYTVFVLVGWASSQIFLGLYFYLQLSISSLYLLLFFITFIYFVSSVLFLPHSQQISQNNHQFSFKQLIPKTYKPLIGGCILMFAVQMFYYRTQFTLDKFGVSQPINTIVVGLSEIIANIILSKYIKRLPRKIGLQILILITIVLFLSLLIIHVLLVQTIIEGLMRMIDTCVMTLLGVYLPQLFPSLERSRGTNFIMSFGVIGGGFSQYILNSLPFWSLSLILVFSLFATFLFKQTIRPQNEFISQI